MKQGKTDILAAVAPKRRYGAPRRQKGELSEFGILFGMKSLHSVSWNEQQPHSDCCTVEKTSKAGATSLLMSAKTVTK